jgi:hypothetical protein
MQNGKSLGKEGEIVHNSAVLKNKCMVLKGVVWFIFNL